MQRVVAGTYGRDGGKMNFTQAAKRVLGDEEAFRLRNAHSNSEYRWFGDYLHDVHPEVFKRLVVYMKIMGEW